MTTHGNDTARATLTATPPQMERPETELATWLLAQERSILRSMVSLVSRPGVVSMAGGLPAADLFPGAELAEAFAGVLTEDRRALQYGPVHPQLLAHIVEVMALRGVECRPEQILLTTGAQQGIALLALALVDEGDAVVTEELTYTGILQALAPRAALRRTVATDLDQGLSVAALDQALGRKDGTGRAPRFLYVIPEGHNPLGVSLAADRRQPIAELCRAHGVLIVEDDPYGLLTYDGPAAPALKSIDPENTFYLGSFSKILAPALRLGWMIVPDRFAERLSIAKEGVDLECSALTQRAVSRLLDCHPLSQRLEMLRSNYRGRRDAMLAALERYMPAGTVWSRPTAGMFVWVDLPPTVSGGCMSSARLVEKAIEDEGIAFIPGHAFAARPGVGESSMRLSFSTLEPAALEDAVRRLGRLVEAELETH